MAALAPSDPADLLQNLSLDGQAKTAETSAPLKKGIYGKNGTVMPYQGHVNFDLYHSPKLQTPGRRYDGQLYGTHHYQYPGSLHQPPPSTGTLLSSNQMKLSQGEFPPPTPVENILSTARSTGIPNNVVNIGNVNRNDGPKPCKPDSQYSSSNVNGPYGKAGMPTGFSSLGYQDPRFVFPLLDASAFTNGLSRHASGAGLSSPLDSRPMRPTSGWGHTSGFMSFPYPNYSRMYGQYGNREDAGFGSIRYNSWTNGRGWVVVDSKYKPKGHGYGNENVNSLSELNRGPRAKGFKNQKELGPATQIAESQILMPMEISKQSNVPQLLNRQQYNGDDVPEDSSHAKFFVIKSYSEDDVHKSIKYSVWSSTPNGNKKLDAAYREAKENHGDCPVYLLFSVNASGQFVGLAEMIGPVDFNKTVEYWQQDKWIGCFPVKWHLIKDVPNSSLRHISLENNENKAVTNSRDTQEVIFENGIEIIKIFKGHNGKTSILDDFGFYAARERIMQEKRAKQRNHKQVLDGQISGNGYADKDKVVSVDKDGSQSLLTVTKPVSAAAAQNSNTEVELAVPSPTKKAGQVITSAC